MTNKRDAGRPALLCAGLLLALVCETTASANVIHVNTTADSGGAGVCALRDALAAAATDTAVNGCAAGSGADTIVFDLSGTITLSETLFLSVTDPVTIDATGRSITLDGHNAVRLFDLDQNTPLTLRSLTLANGFAASGGGGAINSRSGTVMNISNSTFAHNISGCGGAIQTAGSDISTTLTIANSTFYANEASTHECGSASDYGGAILAVETAVTVINSTFSSNRASGVAQILIVRGSFTLANTILTDSLDGPTCSFLDGPSVTVAGMNLVGDTTCGSDIEHFTVTDPKLGPLADNGGPTQTMALLPGSPAIDAADNATCAAAPVSNKDQRGQVRPTDGNNDNVSACDIGAYELTVLFPFTGFFAPVNNAPVVNSVNAGKAVPVKFSLGGNRGLKVLAAGYPQSMQVACNSGSPVDVVEETSSAGASSLSYDPATNVYSYVWKTDKSWSNTCRLFTLRLSDGTDHSVLFQFK